MHFDNSPSNTALLLAQKDGYLSKTDWIIIGFWETAHLPLP